MSKGRKDVDDIIMRAEREEDSLQGIQKKRDAVQNTSLSNQFVTREKEITSSGYLLISFLFFFFFCL